MFNCMKTTLWGTDRHNRLAVSRNDTGATSENTVGYVSQDQDGKWGFIKGNGEILGDERFDFKEQAAAALVKSTESSAQEP